MKDKLAEGKLQEVIQRGDICKTGEQDGQNIGRVAEHLTNRI